MLKTALYVIFVLWLVITLVVIGAILYRLAYPEIRSISSADLVDYIKISGIGLTICLALFLARKLIMKWC